MADHSEIEIDDSFEISDEPHLNEGRGAEDEVRAVRVTVGEVDIAELEPEAVGAPQRDGRPLALRMKRIPIGLRVSS